MLHLSFAPAPGDVVPDTSGAGRHGRLEQGAGYYEQDDGEGPEVACGAALDLMGADDRVVVEHDEALDLGEEFTVAVRVHPTRWSQGVAGDGGWLVSKHRSGDNDRGWVLALKSDPLRARFGIVGRGGLFADRDIKASSWQTIVVTGSASSGRLTTYIDGEIVADVPFPGAPHATDSDLWIGAHNGLQDRQVDGYVDEDLILGRAVDADEAGALLTVENCTSCALGCGDEGVYTARHELAASGFEQFGQESARSSLTLRPGVLTLNDDQADVDGENAWGFKRPLNQPVGASVFIEARIKIERISGHCGVWLGFHPDGHTSNAGVWRGPSRRLAGPRGSQPVWALGATQRRL